MNSTVNRQKLLATLNIVRPAVAAKDYVPILMHFMFDGESVTAYNDIQAITAECDVDIAGCIPADLLIKALNGITAESVMFTKHEGHILLTAGRTKIKLPVLPAKDFPAPLAKHTKALGTFQVTKDMITGLQKCLLAVGSDFNHPAQMGITLDPIFAETEGAFYSTDNVTISRYIFHTDMELPADMQVILPTFFCQQLIALSKLNIDIEVGIYTGALIARFGKDAVLFSKTLVDAEPMDFADIVAKYVDELKLKVLDIPDDFDQSMERAILIQEKEPYKKTLVMVDSKRMKLLSTSTISEAFDEMSYAGDDVKFNIDPSLVKRVSAIATKMSLLRKVMVLTDDDQSYMHLVAHYSI